MNITVYPLFNGEPASYTIDLTAPKVLTTDNIIQIQFPIDKYDFFVGYVYETGQKDYLGDDEYNTYCKVNVGGSCTVTRNLVSVKLDSSVSAGTLISITLSTITNPNDANALLYVGITNGSEVGGKRTFSDQYSETITFLG